MGDAYDYMSLVKDDGKSMYLKMYANGEIIEKWREIYLEGLEMPLSIYDITEIRVGDRSLRFITKDGLYFIVTKDKILFSRIEVNKDIGVIL